MQREVKLHLARLKVCATVTTGSVHTFHILTGLILLQREGVLDLKIGRKPPNKEHAPSAHMVEAVLNDRVRIAYDLSDNGYNLDPESASTRSYLDGVDYYFKRSYKPELHKHFSRTARIHPLGLCFVITTKHHLFNLLGEGGRSLSGMARNIAKWAAGYYRPYALEGYEDIPRRIPDGPILFATQAWDPYGDHGQRYSEDHVAERIEINNMRVECIRLLRQEFGSRFVGGLVPSAYSVKHYPEDILPSDMSKKANFLQLVKQAGICVTTMGLHQSNGWKLGEYVAASKAIVSERLRYVVPGDFSHGRNYLEFDDPQECVGRVAQLISDTPTREEMQVSNYHYYHHHLRPDRLVLNTLMTALGHGTVERTSA